MKQWKVTNQKISVVVPVMNELENIKILNKRLISALSDLTIPFELIYVDDNSTDGTFEYLKKLPKNTGALGKVFAYRKQGEQGKAYSLIEGFAKATGTVLVMIDADLQYPPEAIPDMVKMLEQTDIVVANRKAYHASFIRRAASRIFRKAFGDMLFGLNTDVQSGLKVFKYEVYRTINCTPRSPWTFDLEFLYKSREVGFSITNFDISYVRRENGQSHVRFLNQSFEIGTNALHVRLSRKQPIVIPPSSNATMVGAGIGFKKRQYITHTTLPHHQTALQTFARKQIAFIVATVLTIALAAVRFPLQTIRLIIAGISVVYFIDVVFNLFIVLRSLNSQRELVADASMLSELNDATLPMYSILCPLYKEAAILPQFLKAIEKLDWPKTKLDVLLLLEEDDVQTIKATKKMGLPKYVRTVIVPNSQPKTKPKACNYGLNFAKGEYIVIYDAEDIPDPLQLKKAYLGFIQSPAEVVCLQAKLNYYNPHQNMLTRFFTAEYSLWFDLTLTGFQSIQTSIPLGGTSNHFKTNVLRELQGWDTFNVTEDADLGIRLFKQGYKTEIIDSVTLEEANSNTKNWIRQRSRWLKGYMQSYLVHMRDFAQFARTKGIHALLFQLVIGCKLVFIFLNPLLWILTTLYFVFRAQLGPTIELLYLSPAFYLATISLVFGNFLFLYYYLTGVAKRNQWDLMKYVLLIPVYWLMISIAGWVAFYQLLFKPHYWEKTIHGLHLKKKDNDDEPGDGDQEATEEPVKAPEEKPVRSFFPRPAFITDLVGFVKYSHKRLKEIGSNNFYALSQLFRNKKRLTPNYRKPSILIFNWRDMNHVWAGGAEVYVHELAKRWVAAGNDVMVFCGNDGRLPQNQTIQGVRITRRGGTYTVYAWAMLYYLFIFRGKYDIIIDCENGIPFFTPLFVRKPIFLLVHHVHTEVFREHLPVLLSSVARFLESVCMPIVYRNKQIITVSESSKKAIIKLGFTHPENIVIIHNGIAEKMFTPGKKTNNPTFIYLGRLKPYKNIETAIAAFAGVAKLYPSAHFHIVGDGESRYALEEQVNALQLRSQITFHGKVNEEEKAKMLAESWAMLQPSTMEGWGITVIEANACGTPVIASLVNGLKDSVVDGITGQLVNPRSTQEFTQAMMNIIEDQPNTKRMANRAIEWSKNFTWDKSAGTFYTLLMTALPTASYGSSYGTLAVADTK